MCVRKNIGTLTCGNTDNYVAINNISTNSNNQTGLLSSMTPEQLFRNSVQHGLANMSWDELCGCVVSCCRVRESNMGPHPYAPCVGIGSNINGPYASETNPGIQYVPSAGSILVLNFAEVIQLSEKYYALKIRRKLQSTTASNGP